MSQAGLRPGESPNPLNRPQQEAHYFTFGLEHPLTGRYVRLRGTAESTRTLMITIFGTNWARQYNWHEAWPVIERRDLRELDLGLA